MPHAKPHCPPCVPTFWQGCHISLVGTHRAMEQVISFSKQEMVDGAQKSHKTICCRLGWARFSSPSSRCSAGPCFGSASPCCCCAAIFGGVCAVISVLFLQQPSWRHKIISKIIKHCSQYSSCSKTSSRGGVQMGDSSVRKLTAEAGSRRIIGIQQTLKGQ